MPYSTKILNASISTHSKYPDSHLFRQFYHKNLSSGFSLAWISCDSFTMNSLHTNTMIQNSPPSHGHENTNRGTIEVFDSRQPTAVSICATTHTIEIHCELVSVRRGAHGSVALSISNGIGGFVYRNRTYNVRWRTFIPYKSALLCIALVSSVRDLQPITPFIKPTRFVRLTAFSKQHFY